ncbi:Krueppel-like factor 17 [Myotis lucifugus]|nr:Krueppel-like factor 17 [Myotis lucifugus]
MSTVRDTQPATPSSTAQLSSDVVRPRTQPRGARIPDGDGASEPVAGSSAPVDRCGKSMCVSNMSPSPESSGVHASRNHQSSGIQHLQSPRLERMPLVPPQGPRQNAVEMVPLVRVFLTEYSVNHCPQVTLPPSQMICCPIMSLSQPEMMIFNGYQMSFGEPNIPGMAMNFSGNLSMPPNGPPVTGHPIVSSNRDFLTPEMLSPATVPFAGGQAGFPSLAQMLPPRDPHNCEMPPDSSPSLLTLESQDPFVSQPAPHKDPFLPEPPIPAPQRAQQNCGASERASGTRSQIARPYSCQYENCDKTYTKYSHLLTHQLKHTGERPYKCEWEGCTSSFFRSDELGRHMRIHTNYRPHTCDLCGRGFMRSDHLKQHQRTHRWEPGSPNPQANDEERAGPSAPGL